MLFLVQIYTVEVSVCKIHIFFYLRIAICFARFHNIFGRFVDLMGVYVETFAVRWAQAQTSLGSARGMSQLYCTVDRVWFSGSHQCVHCKAENS